jgi:hypothetical protein
MRLTMTGKWSALILVALCLLGPAAAGTSVATGQGAESEYDLDLPGSGDATPTNAAKDTSSGDSDDGFPVLAIVLFGAAGVGVGLALWRLRTRQAYDRASFDAEDEDR